MRMVPPPDNQLLNQAAARQLLERAGEIDMESTSVDTLRAAAREAGISEAAFEAALTEMRGKNVSGPSPSGPRRSRRTFVRALVVGSALVIAGIASMMLLSRGVPPRSATISYEFLVKCLPMREAQSLAQRLVMNPAYPDNEVGISAGSRTLHIRATQQQLEELQRAFDAAAKQRTTCDNTPAGR